MILAGRGIISPEEWEHNKFIKNYNNGTVAEILSE